MNRSVLRRKAQETGSGIKTLKISQFFTQMRTALKWALAGKQHSYLHRRAHAQKIIQRTLAENFQLELLCLIKMMTVQWPLSLSISYPHIAQKTCKCLHLCKYFLIPERPHWKFGIVNIFNLFSFFVVFNQLLLFLVVQVFFILTFQHNLVQELKGISRRQF